MPSRSARLNSFVYIYIFTVTHFSLICKTTILAALLLIVTSIAGQSYYFRHYQVENGLSNNAVICSAQDKKGFLWFGTKDGLDRFDGYSFKIFRNDPDEKGSIGSNFIHSLYVDPNDVLWVGTEKGLYRYNATTESFTLLVTPFTEQITDIQMDAAGNLWFISNFNLFKYTEAENKMFHFTLNNYFETTSICTLPDGSVWVSTPSGLLKKYNAAINSFSEYDVFSHSPKTVSTWIERLYGTRDGNMLIGTSNQGVKLFQTATGTYKDILTYNVDKTEIFARNFVQTSDNECWIATESGIFIYNLKTGTTINLHKDYSNPYSISDNAVYTFCKDKEGGIWAGTYFGGISYYPKQPLTFHKYFPEEGKNSLSGNVVREIHQDQYGSLWIGTEDAGLNKFDKATGLFKPFKPTGNKEGISYTNIHGLLATGNELWIGTFEHGLDVMNIQTGKVVRHYSKGSGGHSLKSNFIHCISQSGNGEIMLGTTIGAYMYNRDRDNFSALPGMPLYNWYSSILKDDQGTIWAATYGNGVNYYNTKTKKGGNFRYEAQNKNSLSSDRVNSLFQDSYKNLWLATEGGLCRFDPKTNSFKRYTTKNGLPTNFILSLLEDDKKNLWISTSKGLLCFNPRTTQAIVYTTTNGLLNDQFNFSSAYKDLQGRMYFGSVKGMISFHPDEFIKNNYSPLVYITGFQVNNKELAINKNGSPLTRSITYTEKINLKHNQSTFSIDFASFSYSAPEMSEYAYKMEGLDQDWTYLKTNRKAYFTELSPGTYTFKVKAANSSGDWNVRESNLIIEILPPWWASTTAYFFYAALALFIIYYLTRNYHRRIKEKNRRKIEQLEIAKEKELYEAKMEFFTNVAHEIKTPLTLIKGPLEKVVKKAGGIPEIKDSLRIMEKNTSRLVDLTNQLLDFRQTEIRGFSLNFTKQNITELIEDNFISFKPLAEQKDLQFTMSPLPQKLFAFIDAEAFNKILTNLFSNAVKYASTKVELCLLPVKKDDKTFTIEIKNDGYLIPFEMKEKIFEPFFRLKETEKQKGTGIGLALSRSLAQLQKGVLDLKESENNMNVFSLTMPFNLDGNTTILNEEPEKDPETVYPEKLIKTGVTINKTAT
ncbi:MAG TPA: two-component regulator propeller domain-containing protein [Chitinophagaceae bacterium]|nr:two-component regulator propeller domain-containing protein [Chitinophagaceae bacterium]